MPNFGPVDDDDYADDQDDDNAVTEPLPEPADPSHIPPDEGDAGQSGVSA
jgi:hypothetical protein